MKQQQVLLSGWHVLVLGGESHCDAYYKLADGWFKSREVHRLKACTKLTNAWLRRLLLT
jgi:hypothetical protein